jgi:tryptophanyl-tRNA synthetase
VREMAIDLLACGFDPEKSVLFKQSDVPEVTELTWILSCSTPMGLLERCVSYKDKIAQGIAPSHGLFAYPVLMAADILLYDSDVVPVGKDQKQHLEVTRDIAIKMNERYGEGTMKLPEPRIREGTALVPGIDGQKMSKSYDNTIPIFDTEKRVRKRVMQVVTDSTAVEEPKPVEGSNILALYRLVAGADEVAAMEARFRAGGEGYGVFKQELFEAIWAFFEGARAKRAEIEADEAFVNKVLEQGAEKARAEGRGVLERVRKAVGLV